MDGCAQLFPNLSYPWLENGCSLLFIVAGSAVVILVECHLCSFFTEDEESESENGDAFFKDKLTNRGLASSRGQTPGASPDPAAGADDPLKWIEENIPEGAGDAPLPVLDSDEEIETTKFEISKMQ